MSGAYQNLGIVLTGLTTNAHGEINTYGSYLQNGDELVNLTSNARYWVINNPAYSGSGTTKKLIDRSGFIVPSLASSSVKVIRSGYRNVLSASVSSVVSLNNPIQSGHLQLISNADLTSLKVINASATTFDEEWALKPSCSLNYNPLIANTSYCFNFGTPFYSSVYNNSGTRILGNSANPYTGSDNELVGPLWGGGGTTNELVYDSLVAADSIRAVPPAGIPDSYCPATETSCTITNTGPASTTSQLPLIRSGIWSSSSIYKNLNEVMGFDTCITNPTSSSKTYFFGFGVDNAISVYIDGNFAFGSYTANSYMYWTITPYTLSPGKHVVHVEFYNRCTGPPADNSANPAIVGMEIYDNTLSQLAAATSVSDLNIIFTTAGLRGSPSVLSFRTIDGSRVYHYLKADGSLLDVCSSRQPVVVNPYIEGYKGNWRPYQTLVYQQSRKYSDIFNPANKGMGIANAGYINAFYSYWYYGTPVSGQPGWIPNATTGASRWVTANTVTLYDKYGQQLENKDALGRYSAAKFDFNGELPAAVASNAMNREIYASSFEDSKFKPGTVSEENCNPHEFAALEGGAGIQTMIDSSISHSGNYCARLSGFVGFTTIIHNVEQKTFSLLNFDSQKQYILQPTSGHYPNDFEPYPGKKYMFSAWINDGAPKVKSVSGTFQLIVNGSAVTLNCKAIVEGWKLVEGSFNVPTSGSLTIDLEPSGPVYIDDIRMHPYDSHMKTYAYDDKTMRLMAEMDENGFATFYEYDDEGLLVRVKKETERGVMTLKESRSSYKKATP